MKHIEFAKLVEIFEGSPSEIEELEISEHLIVCPECSFAAKKLEEFFVYTKSEWNEEVAHNVTANLLNIYRPEKTSAIQQTFTQKLLGELIFDDWQFALNERLSFSDSRQLLYHVNQYDIDLRLSFADGKCIVKGQIFPDVHPKASLKISSLSESKEIELDQHGEFIFPALDEGIYKLLIDFDKTQIEIENVSLLG